MKLLSNEVLIFKNGKIVYRNAVNSEKKEINR